MIGIMRILNNRKTFLLCQKRGLHITSNSCYSPIPDTTKLKDALWSKHSELIGIDINEREQLELLSCFVSKFKNEYELFPMNRSEIPYEYCIDNGSFTGVDAEILYSMIRHYKPRRIYEIGSGNSTYLSAQAVLINAEEDSGYHCELVAIDPNPNEILKAGFPGLSTLIAKEVQDVPLSEFEKLSENDILFIDSSHVLRIGNDVQYEYLDILPRLNKGVIVHAHDIFFPAEYPKEWVLDWHWFWTEQYLLQAFLAFNNSFEVLWASSYMHLKYPGELRAAFSSYDWYSRDERRVGPGSFWIRRIR